MTLLIIIVCVLAGGFLGGYIIYLLLSYQKQMRKMLDLLTEYNNTLCTVIEEYSLTSEADSCVALNKLYKELYKEIESVGKQLDIRG